MQKTDCGDDPRNHAGLSGVTAPSWRIRQSCMGFALRTGLTVEQVSEAGDLAGWNDYAASLKRRSAIAWGSWRWAVKMICIRPGA
jgi:hypothetical protein